MQTKFMQDQSKISNKKSGLLHKILRNVYKQTLDMPTWINADSAKSKCEVGISIACFTNKN